MFLILLLNVATTLQQNFIASAVSWKFITDLTVVGLKSERFYNFGLDGLRGACEIPK
jgi:hypothetical protein